ncbi:MAG: FkbM family methyltransferase [Planctomycetia bacterium]|nr:FkbM family methyltransferase [Planctomycetia bacterium]
MNLTAGKPYYQKVSYRLLKGLFKDLNIKVGTRQIKVPLVDIAGLHLLHWTENWKTQLMSHALNQRVGAVLDIGVNVGQTLLDYLSVQKPAARYFGFEPNAYAVAYVMQLIRMNQLSDIHLVPIGLSNSAGVVSLSMETSSSVFASDASITEYQRPDRQLTHMYIPCFRFDDIRQSVGIPQVAFVKIDVEGAELEVLQGMTEVLKNDRPLITCEVLHRDPKYPIDAYQKTINAMQQLLVSHSYHLLHVVKTGEQFQLKRVENFSDKILKVPDVYTECDYLFVPADHDWKLQQWLMQ